MGNSHIHSGSLPSSIAFRFPILPFADFAAAIVFVISLWPRLSPATFKAQGQQNVPHDPRIPREINFIPNTTVPAYVEASFMKLGPNVNEAGASTDEATV